MTENTFADPDIIEAIIKNSKTIAVVGLSDKPDRDSNGVASYLQREGYKIIPVNPAKDNILGEKSYPDLSSIPEPVKSLTLICPQFPSPLILLMSSAGVMLLIRLLIWRF